MKVTTKALFASSLLFISVILVACKGLGSGSGSNTGSGSSSTGSSFTVGGTVTGLAGNGLVLQNNGGDNLAVTGTGTVSFTFKTAVAKNGAYAVTVSTQPTNPTQACTVANGSGTATANVTSVQVNCQTASISVGGTVAGLKGTGLLLQNNGGDDLTITADGTFAFKTLLLNNTAYSVTIKTQPSNPAQNCTVSNGSGTTGTTNVTNVQIVCPIPTFSIGGTVVGLLGNGGGMELQDNAGDNLSISGNGPFTFATPITFGGAYNVTIFSEPSSQGQICAVFGGAGSANAPVTNIVVDCGHNDWTWITGSNTSNAVGVGTYKTMPPSPQQDTNTPGARYNQATWTDLSGNLWMFSGYGFSYDSTIKIQPLYLDELWEFIGTSDYNCLANNCLPRPGNGWLVYPTSSSTAPTARAGATTWTDASGKLWLFGGQDGEGGNVPIGLRNDLWYFDPLAKTWTAVVATTGYNATGSYGTQGVAAASNIPGARWNANVWVDAAGNFWIFGGKGYDSAGTNGLLNDLWQFNPTTKMWTWMGPAKSNLADQNGIYGTQGTASASNAPGGRQSAAAWKDSSGNFWLFGGFGLDSAGTPNGILNDLWTYSLTSGQWTWMGPTTSSGANQHGVYGTQGTAAATNAPGGRWLSAAWTDHNGNLWLYGGFGLGTTDTGLLNDLWEYTLVATSGYPAVNQWTWVKGANTTGQAGTYGNASVPFYLNNPGSRGAMGYWTTFDSSNQNQLWIFGGQGYDSTAGSGNGLLNDLWRYLPYP